MVLQAELSEGAAAMKNEASILLAKHLEELGHPFQREYRFHPRRKWRFDFILQDRQTFEHYYTAIEIEGGLYSRGRHVRGKGYQADLDKYNAAAADGWFVFRFSTQDVLTGRAKKFLQEHL